MIPLAIARLRESLTEELEDLLAPDVVLVPAPRSAPFTPGQRDVSWVPRRICEELIRAGLGQRQEPWLVRHTAVPKSAYSSRGQRPSAQEHHASMRVDRRISDNPARITLVDDVITKGSTLLAGASLLAEAFPDSVVRAFALVRTTSWGFSRIVDPVFGHVTFGRWGARRNP